MRDEDDGDAERFVQAFQQRENLLGRLRVERRGRLVAQQNARVVGEGARNGHALLLSAGKLRGICVGLVVDLHQPQQLLGFFPHLRAG